LKNSKTFSDFKNTKICFILCAYNQILKISTYILQKTKIALSCFKNIKWKPSNRCPSGKSLRPRGLLLLWSQVQALWLLIRWPLKAYMIVNFRTREISRGAHKLTRAPTLIKKIQNGYCNHFMIIL
jgi:hypothetical protein